LASVLTLHSEPASPNGQLPTAEDSPSHQAWAGRVGQVMRRVAVRMAVGSTAAAAAVIRLSMFMSTTYVFGESDGG